MGLRNAHGGSTWNVSRKNILSEVYVPLLKSDSVHMTTWLTSRKSAIENSKATFAGKDIYISMEEKCSNICYSIINNHAFIDGNKMLQFTFAGGLFFL